MVITQKMKIDLALGHMREVLKAVQGDENSRAVEIALLDNGTAWEAPEGASGVVRYRRADGTGGNYDTTPSETKAVSLSGNVATVQIAPEVLAVPGTAHVTVGIISGSSVLHTFVFQIDVQKNPGYNVTADGGFYMAGTLPDSGWAPFKYLGTDANGKVIVKDAPTGGGGGSGLLIVTLDRENGVASHSSTEIIEYLNSGGFAVVRIPSSDTTWGEVPFWSVIGETVIFSDDAVSDSAVTNYQYSIHADKTFTMQETAMKGGATEAQATQIKANADAIAEIEDPVVSGELTIESQKYTATLTLESGGTEVMILETDEKKYPTKMTYNGREIPWTVTEV